MEIDDARLSSRPSGPTEQRPPNLTMKSSENSNLSVSSDLEAPEELQEDALEPKYEEEHEIESDEEASEENNIYLRLIKSSVEGESKTDFKTVPSPVIAPHSGNKPPLAALSVYDAIVSQTLPLISSQRTFRSVGTVASSFRSRTRTRRTPFLEEHSMTLWRPLEVPNSLLIDPSPPRLTDEWETILNTKTSPQITTLIDPENMLSSPLVVHWGEVSVLPRGRKYAKRGSTSLTTASNTHDDLEEDEANSRPETPASKVHPRAAKKRTRDMALGIFKDDDMTDPVDRKRKATEVEVKQDDSSQCFILRLNIAKHLSFEQMAITNALKASSSSVDHMNVKSEDRDAAELLELFRSSDTVPPLTGRSQLESSS